MCNLLDVKQGSSAGPEGRSRFKRECTLDNSPEPPEEFKRYQTLPPIKNVKNEKELDEHYTRKCCCRIYHFSLHHEEVTHENIVSPHNDFFNILVQYAH